MYVPTHPGNVGRGRRERTTVVLLFEGASNGTTQEKGKPEHCKTSPICYGKLKPVQVWRGTCFPIAVVSAGWHHQLQSVQQGTDYPVSSGSYTKELQYGVPQRDEYRKSLDSSLLDSKLLHVLTRVTGECVVSKY